MYLNPQLTEEELKRLETEQPWIDSNYDPNNYIIKSDCWEMKGTLVDEACTFPKPDGSVLFKLIKKPLSTSLQQLTWDHLRHGGNPVHNSSRGRTVGREDSAHQEQFYATEKTIGYFDRQGGRFPYCRKTHWTKEYWPHFKKATPVIQEVDAIFRSEMPERYAAQRAIADTTPDYLIANTAFSTMTVNLGVRTTPHKDEGDLEQGFGVVTITAMTPTPFEGGELIFPKYGVGVIVRNGDVLLCDVHELHCNARFRYNSRGFIRGWERLACVFYYRKRMQNCLAPPAELRDAQARMTNSWGQ
jgi:hypothetical protein